jgi:hypothetical protein
MSIHSIDAFWAFLRAGLWANSIKFTDESSKITENLNWNEIYQLAEEQSVVGLILEGIEHSNVKPSQDFLLQWIGEVQIIEQTNKEMNKFIEKLVGKMREEDIFTLIIKGQGIAQCYERPLWRASGDIDFYLNNDNYTKAKKFFRPLVDKFDPDNETALHINMHYGDWVVEIHGNQHCSLSARVNRVMDEIHRDLFYGGNVRSWMNGHTTVFLPSPDNDVLIVFTHYLNHFFRGGVGVRQICDWCRLLWTYRDSLNTVLLESRIREMGLMNVWKGFAAFAVEYLGIPVEAMPFYSSDKKWKRKADRICSFILEVGNFGHNRDSSYYNNDSKLLRKAASFERRCGDMIRHTKIFPLETIRFFPNIFYYGLKAAARGE